MKSIAGILMIAATAISVPAGAFAQETGAEASVAAVQRRLNSKLLSLAKIAKDNRNVRIP
jgi:hypothetical protein